MKLNTAVKIRKKMLLEMCQTLLRTLCTTCRVSPAENTSNKWKKQKKKLPLLWHPCCPVHFSGLHVSRQQIISDKASAVSATQRRDLYVPLLIDYRANKHTSARTAAITVYVIITGCAEMFVGTRELAASTGATRNFATCSSYLGLIDNVAISLNSWTAAQLEAFQ
jgi:hypothetical protein